MIVDKATLATHNRLVVSSNPTGSTIPPRQFRAAVDLLWMPVRRKTLAVDLASLGAEGLIPPGVGFRGSGPTPSETDSTPHLIANYFVDAPSTPPIRKIAGTKRAPVRIAIDEPSR